MSQLISTYIAKKATLEICVDWADKIGKQYAGSSGGVGYLESIKLAWGDDAPAIYYQRASGDPVHHFAPAEIAPYLEAAILAAAPAIVADAIARQRAEVQALAGAVVAEYAALAAEAGIELPQP